MSDTIPTDQDNRIGIPTEPRYLLQELLLSNAFQTGIKRLAAFSIKSGFEGGVAAYSNGAIKVDLPKDPRNEISLMMSADSFAEGYANFAADTLLVSKDRTIRKDVRLFVHSHPIQPRESSYAAQYQLRPSSQDLETWERHNVVIPGCVWGVLVPFGGGRNLFMWRKPPEIEAQSYDAAYDGTQSRNRLLGMLADSGIRTAELNMAAPVEAYIKQVGQAAEKLYL